MNYLFSLLISRYENMNTNNNAWYSHLGPWDVLYVLEVKSMSEAKSCGKSARDGKVFVTSAQIKNSFEISNNGRWKMPSLKSSRLIKQNMSNSIQRTL